MKPKITHSAKLFLVSAQHTLSKQDLPTIVKCLQQLSEEQIWWRPNRASNSAGNLVLHLCGNVRQWIISNLGGQPFTRERDLEFAERGPIPRTALIRQMRQTVRQACGVLAELSDGSLARKHTIQGLHVTGLEAVFHVSEHFSYHTGQIVYITKLKRSRDLRFTRLPKEKRVIPKTNRP